MTSSPSFTKLKLWRKLARFKCIWKKHSNDPRVILNPLTLELDYCELSRSLTYSTSASHIGGYVESPQVCRRCLIIPVIFEIETAESDILGRGLSQSSMERGIFIVSKGFQDENTGMVVAAGASGQQNEHELRWMKEKRRKEKKKERKRRGRPKEKRHSP